MRAVAFLQLPFRKDSLFPKNTFIIIIVQR